jgi:hypothetical protein
MNFVNIIFWHTMTQKTDFFLILAGLTNSAARGDARAVAV